MKNLLNNSLTEYAKLPCLIDGDRQISLSFNDINKMSAGVAEYLRKEYGIAASQKITLIYHNSLEYVIIFHALIKLKAIPIPLSDELTLPEYTQYLSFINPARILVSKMELYTSLHEKFDTVVRPLEYSTILLMKHHPEIFCNYPDYCDDEIGVIIFTSGTSNNPKGVLLKFNGLMKALEQCASRFKIYCGTRTFQVMPFSHAEGCFSTMFLPWISGSSVVFINKLDINKIMNYWKYVYENNVNYLIVLPALLQTLLDVYREANDNFYIAQYAKCGSSFLSPKTREDFETKFRIKIIDVYGSTEANAISVGDTELNKYDYSVGKLTHISDVKVNKENEIMVKNSKWFAGYLNAPDTTANVFDGTWYKTGDLGQIKKQKLYLWGRKDDIINRNGYKITPQEIDAIVQKDHFVSDSFTIGVKDQHMNDVIITFVILRDHTINLDIIKKQLYLKCMENLSVYKLPDRIIFTDKILRNSVGKPSKKRMTDLYNQNTIHMNSIFLTDER